MQFLQDHPSPVDALAFSADAETLAAGGRNGAVWLYDPSGVGRTIPFRSDAPVNALAYHPNGDPLVVATTANWGRLDVTTLRRIVRHEANCMVTHRINSDGHGDNRPRGKYVEPRDREKVIPTTAAAFVSSDLLALGFGDRLKLSPGRLELWDAAKWERIEPIRDEPHGVRALAVCPAKTLVAWATGHKKVSVWDIRKQDAIHFPQTANVPAVALSRDGAVLAVAVDWTAKLYDLERRKERAVLKGHKGRVSAVAFSPDGSTLATGSWDRTVRLWDVATGREQRAFSWDVGQVCSLAYAPDGQRLAAGGDAGTVVVWDAE